MNNFSYSYFSGANVSVLVNVNNKDVSIDCAGLSYSVNYGNSPIYSYCSELFDAVLRGREMVQGSFVLNHISARSMSKLLNDAWTEELGISFLNARTFDFIIKFSKEKSKNVILKDCAIISRGQTIQIDSMNILEEYTFVGKEVLYSVENQGKTYSEMKGVIKKKRKPFTEEQTANDYEVIKIIKKSNDIVINFEDVEMTSNAVSLINVRKKIGKGGELNTVYARDNVPYTVRSPLNSERYNNESNTKAWLNYIFFDQIRSDENKKENVKKMLAYMLDKERGTTLANLNRPSLSKEELDTERAGLLWVSANRMYVKKNKLQKASPDGNSNDSNDDLLLSIFNNEAWANYGEEYRQGKYNAPSESSLDFVENFLQGKYMNEIFVHTNFVHANDNLPQMFDWVLGPDQKPTGKSAYEPTYIGNAIFSTGFQETEVQKLKRVYEEMYPDYYSNSNEFTIPYSERQ